MRLLHQLVSVRIFIAIAMLVSCGAATARAWTPNAQEQEIANLMIQASGQRRAFLQFDPILAQVARERAADMARRNYFDHINPDGHGANYLVRQAGYALSAGYPADGNNLESIAAGGSTASVTWSDWMGSAPHKTHLLGELDFFATQTSYGVGYYEDPGARYRYYWVVITAPPMPRTASVAIASPASGASVPEGAVAVSGTTSGTPPAASVQISVENANGVSAWTTAAGAENWSTTVNDFAPGTNTLRARSLDSNGALLAQTSITFQYVVLRPLTIHVVGEGSVPHFEGTTSRKVGTIYTIAATPAVGWLFSGWSGSFDGAQATLNVRMVEGLDATATFIPNPFVAKRGMYSGLIGAETASHASRGLLRLQLNAFGRITGQLVYAGKGYAVLGQFRTSGRATVRIAREGAGAILLVLDLNGAADGIGGTLIDAATTNTFTVAPVRQAGASLAALAGRYTVAFPADRASADPNVPKGDGYGVLVVSESGAAMLSVALADGTAFSRGGWVAEDGSFPFYAALYARRGELSGMLNFSDTAQSDLAGALFWQRPHLPAAARFPLGFDSTIAAAGARYTAPAAGQPVLAVSAATPNAQLVFGAGDFSSEIIQPADVSADNLVAIASPAVDQLVAAIDADKGTFSGRFTHPVTGAKTLFRGVILQKQDAGCGFFLGLEQSGYTAIGPAP